jgi:hypothetical protein
VTINNNVNAREPEREREGDRYRFGHSYYRDPVDVVYTPYIPRRVSLYDDLWYNPPWWSVQRQRQQLEDHERKEDAAEQKPESPPSNGSAALGPVAVAASLGAVVALVAVAAFLTGRSARSGRR